MPALAAQVEPMREARANAESQAAADAARAAAAEKAQAGLTESLRATESRLDDQTRLATDSARRVVHLEEEVAALALKAVR